MTVRIKICGVRSPEVAEHVSRAGADAIGLVFYPGSVRAVDTAAAAEIAAAVSPLVSVVGLFVDADPDQVHRVLERYPLDLLQFHGAEDDAYCRQFNQPFLKAIAMRPDVNVASCLAAYPSARGFLFDSCADGRSGGTGVSFDWSRLPAEVGRPWLLAGGLHAENVGEALRQTCAPAVDVSGGVESEPGHKCLVKISAFVDAVRGFERSTVSE